MYTQQDHGYALGQAATFANTNAATTTTTITTSSATVASRPPLSHGRRSQATQQLELELQLQLQLHPGLRAGLRPGRDQSSPGLLLNELAGLCPDMCADLADMVDAAVLAPAGRSAEHQLYASPTPPPPTATPAADGLELELDPLGLELAKLDCKLDLTASVNAVFGAGGDSGRGASGSPASPHSPPFSPPCSGPPLSTSPFPASTSPFPQHDAQVVPQRADPSGTMDARQRQCCGPATAQPILTPPLPAGTADGSGGRSNYRGVRRHPLDVKLLALFSPDNLLAEPETWKRLISQHELTPGETKRVKQLRRREKSKCYAKSDRKKSAVKRRQAAAAAQDMMHMNAQLLRDSERQAKRIRDQMAWIKELEATVQTLRLRIGGAP